MGAWTVSAAIIKADTVAKTVTGWAVISADARGIPIVDSQNDVIPIHEIEKAAHALVSTGGTHAAGRMHSAQVGDLVESIVVTKEKRAALGWEGDAPDGWLVSLRINDPETLQKLDQYPELSIRGTGKRVPNLVKDISIDEISLVDKGASGDGKHRPRIVLVKRAADNTTDKQLIDTTIQKEFKMPIPDNVKAILDSMSDEQKGPLMAWLESMMTEKKDEPKPDPMAEADPEVRKRVDEIDTLAKQALADNEKLRSELAKRDEAVELAKRATFIREKHLPGVEPDKFAPVLLKISRALTSDEYGSVETLLSTLSKASRLSQQLSPSGMSQSEAGSAAQQIMERARVMLSKSADGKLKLGDAIAKIAREDPALYAEYVREARAGVR